MQDLVYFLMHKLGFRSCLSVTTQKDYSKTIEILRNGWT